MGYSITLRTKTPALREQLVSFFEEHYRSWNELAEYDIVQAGWTTEPGYDEKGPTVFGFNYKSGVSSWEREYVYTLLRWAALKVGELRSFEGEFPYIIYDGEENWPLVVGETCDELGLKEALWLRREAEVFDDDYSKLWETLCAELRRLDGLWKGAYA